MAGSSVPPPTSPKWMSVRFEVVHDELHGLQQQVDAFLLAHHADVADEILAAAA